MVLTLFRLVDVPRIVRRLTPPVPLLPDATEADADAAMRDVQVEWALRPALLNPRSARMRERVAEAVALYDGLIGQPRSAVEDLAPRIEDIFDDYRLARCLARTIESLGYHYEPPPRALPAEPAALRARCYRLAQERYRGYVPRARRATFLAELAAEWGGAAAQAEADLWADRPGAMLLRAGTLPAGADRHGQGEAPAPVRPQPARIIDQYNAGAVGTLLAASSWVTLFLPTTETAALKDLYRHAKALHVGVELALRAGTGLGGEKDLLAVTLYGPGSRALVRGRQARGVVEGTPDAGPAESGAGVYRSSTAAVEGATPPHDPPDESGELDAPAVADDMMDAGPVGPGSTLGSVSVPAPGGLPVASVVARLLRCHPRAVRDGWARLLGQDGRLFHAPLDEPSLAALRDVDASTDRVAEGDASDAGDVGDAVSYDSAVEADFARAFLAAEVGGRLGVARGWSMEREPRVVIVGDTVFLPDFSFARGDVETLCEVIGYYTEDYLTRKRRKLAALRGRIQLLLIVDQERAPLFEASGFPMVTYRAGRQIGVTEVAQALDAYFDPFARRRAPAGRALARLCAAEGPRLSEEEICAAIGCAGRTELTTVWSDLPPDAGAGEVFGSWAEGAPLFQRRYLPGYGLAPAGAVEQARAALATVLDGADGGSPLDEVVALCEGAGLPEPDDALIAELGGAVVRAGLFGEARVYRAGAVAEQALVTALSAGLARPRRRRS